MYFGREKFSDNLIQLIWNKEETKSEITTEELIKCGNAEDYLRVSSNVSTLVELYLGVQHGLDVSRVFSFASRTMPIIAAILSSNKPLHVFYKKENTAAKEILDNVEGLGFEFTHSTDEPSTSGDRVSLFLTSDNDTVHPTAVDCLVETGVLFIFNADAVPPEEVLVRRKRMATPKTTPHCLSFLEHVGGLRENVEQFKTEEKDVKELSAHLQQLCGTEVSQDNAPVLFTAGLPALCSFYTALMEGYGGGDIVMCSTAYGGSSQLTDLVTDLKHYKNTRVTKSTFDIQGEINLLSSLESKLGAMAERKDLAPLTVLFVEIPTNPDMKVPDLEKLASLCRKYKETSKKEFLLLIDTTFSPQTKLMEKLKALFDELAVMVFISLSKSISRGKTTGGCMIANHTEVSRGILSRVRKIGKLYDTTAKEEQVQSLVENHVGVEERLQKAYQRAVHASDCLLSTVKELTNHEMTMHFVSPEQGKLGFTPATMSFNLPPVGSAEENAALAQRFVDLLCVHKEFKACVSFGHDNGRVYATVPATSTQGAIREEDKAKQAVGGVQLVRLSFSPAVDSDKVAQIIKDSLHTVYKKN